jgi:thioredoxin-like negative regulator of GroEL
MSPLPIITKLDNVAAFRKCLEENPGYFIMKLGAEWCGPCKKIEAFVASCMSQSPDNVQCAVIDIDHAFELYGFLKTKRMVNGVPAILAYQKGNLNYVPDDFVVGSDTNQIAALFARCYQEANSMKQT